MMVLSLFLTCLIKQGRLAGTTSHPDDDRPTAQIAAKVKQTAQKASDKTKAKRDEHLNKGEHKTKTPHYAFEANKFQLLGTLPKDLRNKYVPYRPLIGFIFSGNGIRGWFLQRGLHAQHRRIYCYDKATKYGLVASPPAISKLEAGEVKNELSPHQKEEVKDEDEFAAARQFLEMVHFDEKPGKDIPGGRLYTYVITLQGEWRFTETGPEFAIQFLSKHSMHSDVSREIACAGEFFIRRRRHKGGMKLSDGHDDTKPEIDGKGERVEDSGRRSDSFEGPGYGSAAESEDKDKKQSEHKEEDKKQDEHKEEDEKTETGSHDKDEISEGHGEAESSRQDSLQVSKKASHKAGGSRDPRNFVLIIDNDSGTYRPDSKSLPSLQKYLEQNLPGLKIKAMPCDSEQLKKWKEEQKPKKAVVKARRVEQQSSSSSSSSDQDV
jgi:Ni/Co efflux regulator RcnB